MDIKESLRLHKLWIDGDNRGKRADFHGADLRGADLRGADLRGADLGNAILHGAKLSGSNLSGSNLRGADLRCSNLFRAKLSGADLRSASLRNAILHGANLVGSNLAGADLVGADLLCAGDGRYIKTMQVSVWAIGYTHETLQIGCQRHLVEAWREFDDETISAMDSRALEWWRAWKPILMKIIDASPALTPQPASEAAQ